MNYLTNSDTRPSGQARQKKITGRKSNLKVANPRGCNLRTRNWWIKACGVFLLWTATAFVLPAQTFTTLHNFDGTDGSNPAAAPIQGPDGNLYGTTVLEANGAGSVYKITPTGTLTTIHSFTGPDGFEINGPLVLATDGNFYDTTVAGGGGLSQGTVFKITPSGAFTSLYSFCPLGPPCVDGYNPEAGLTEGTDGNLYGTTFWAGTADISCGTIFKISPSGTLTTLLSLDWGDGCNPWGAPIEAPNGNFYGTTNISAYKMTPGGMVTTLATFDGPDGYAPRQPILASDGNFYGTTLYVNDAGPGIIFKMTPSGNLTTIYTFCTLSGCSDGESPYDALVQATDGNLYGTTSAGGANGDGTVFQITRTGTLTTLHSFDGTDGATPYAGLFQATNGILYGATSGGGANGDGTVFSLDLGLGPFVETVPAVGPVGLGVRILGTNLTGATSVTFNGTAAAFTVVSRSLIRATVPAGAATGSVQVTTPSGTLTSNAAFRVRP